MNLLSHSLIHLLTYLEVQDCKPKIEELVINYVEGMEDMIVAPRDDEARKV